MARFSHKDREARLAEVARRYLQGERQMDIAKATGVSDAQIHEDLAKLVKRWQAAALADTDALRGKELAKLDNLEDTYWQAWLRSLTPRERSTTERSENGHIKNSASLTRENRDGNPQYLAGVMSCIDRRCKLLGLDAPTKIDISPRAREIAAAAGLEADDIIREVENIMRELKAGKS